MLILTSHVDVTKASVRGSLLVLVLVLTVGGAGIARAGPAAEARDRAAEARAQEQALAADITAQSEQIDAVERDIGVLAGELAKLEEQLARSQSRLRALEAELAEKTRTIARARKEFRTAQGHLSERVVEIYTSEEPDAVEVIFGAESLDTLLDRIEMRTRVLDYDTELIGRIESLRARVTRERQQTAALRRKQAAETSRIAQRTSERRAVMAGLVARRDSLSALRSARRRALASVQVQRREWEAQANALQSASAQVASAILPVRADGQTETPTPAASSSLGFVWPVHGSLVSPYGQRWGQLHAGIDIAAPAGTPIVASASGQVVYAGSMSGYGLIVVIQHAGGIATAYAHNSSISVSVGQSVGQGQTIAAVGCTGHCYGDHVHFEVRAGGSPVDPMVYL